MGRKWTIGGTTLVLGVMLFASLGWTKGLPTLGRTRGLQAQHCPKEPTAGQQSYLIQIQSATFNCLDLARPDEICVWDGTVLAGSVVWTGATPLNLFTWADDPWTSDVVEGYQCGHPIKFTVWNSSQGKDYPALASFTTGNGTFCDGLLSVVQLDVSAVPAAVSSCIAAVVSPWPSPTAEISWPTNDPEDCVDSYEIYKKAPGEDGFSLHGSVPATATSFVDASLCRGLHTYRIAAVNGSGEGPPAECDFYYSGLPFCKHLAQVNGERRGHSVFLRWSLVGLENAEGFQVHRREADGIFSPIHADLLRQNSFVDENAPSGEVFYRVVKVHADGSREYSEILSLGPAAATSVPGPRSEQQVSWGTLKHLFR